MPSWLVATSMVTLSVIAVPACGSRESRTAQAGSGDPALASPAGKAPPLDAPARPVVPDDPYVENRRLLITNDVSIQVKDPRVLSAMLLTPRHEFVPPAIRGEAYEDRPLPIG